MTPPSGAIPLERERWAARSAWGGWRDLRRRKIGIPKVQVCQENKIAAADPRWPKDGREGDMPRIMMVLGDYDALECRLSGIGIDNDELVPGFTTPTKHSHVLRGIGGGASVNGPPGLMFFDLSSCVQDESKPPEPPK